MKNIVILILISSLLVSCAKNEGTQGLVLQENPASPKTFCVYGPSTLSVDTIIIPDKVRDGLYKRSVTMIADNAFKGNKNVRVIILPPSVTTIGANAFQGCTALEEIVFPEGLREIKNSAFAGCVNLNNVTLPDSVINLGQSIFRGCSNLKTISLPKDLKKIPNGMFAECINLNVDFPLDFEIIGHSAFKGCHVDAVTFSATSVVCDSAFYGCKGLTYVTLWCDIQLRKASFAECQQLEQISSPFEGDELKVVFGTSAFSGCTNLQIIDANVDARIGEHAFDGCKSLQIVQLAKALVGQYAFNGCSNLTEFPVEHILKIEAYAFNGCSHLDFIVPMDDANKIEENAFIGIHNLIYQKPESDLDFVRWLQDKEFKEVTSSSNLASRFKLRVISDKIYFVHESTYMGVFSMRRLSPSRMYFAAVDNDMQQLGIQTIVTFVADFDEKTLDVKIDDHGYSTIHCKYEP